MTKATSNGAGILLPGHKAVKRGKTAVSSEVPRLKPTPACHPNGWPCPLSPPARAALRRLCGIFQVRPEYVVQEIVECFLVDACSDDTLAAVTARQAREIEQNGGQVPPDWWEGVGLLMAPGFENFTEERA